MGGKGAGIGPHNSVEHMAPKNLNSGLTAEVMFDGSLFHRLAPETGNARLPTVVTENDGAFRRLEQSLIHIAYATQLSN